MWDEELETDNVWLSIADLPSDGLGGTVSESRERISDSAAQHSRVVAAGTLLCSFKLTLGRLAFAGRDLYTNEAIAALPLRTDRVLPRFLFYYLSYFDWDAACEGDVKLKGKTLNKTKLKRIVVNFPERPEQQRIVTILDEAFEGITTAADNSKRSLGNARAVLDARMGEVFGGHAGGSEEKRLGDVCGITSKLVDPRLDEFRDLIHVGAANIQSQTGVLGDLRTAQEEGLVSGKFLFDDSMVLYSKIRPYLMKVARPGFSGLCSADMYPLAPTDGQVTRDYLYYLLLSKPFTDYAVAGSARTGMPKVNRDHLFEFRTFLPSVEEQHALSSELDALAAEVSVLQTVYQNKLDALDTLKKSLLNEAFSGNL